MRSVGEILKEARERKGISLVQVEEATKIKRCFLEALEKNDFSKINEVTVVKGFIKNYAEYLGFSSDEILAIFRRDFIEDQKGQILPRGLYKPLSWLRLVWYPRTSFWFVGGILFLIIFGYLAFQVFGFLGPPRLEINSPQNKEIFGVQEVKVRGKTNPDAVVYVNGEIVLVLSDGSFEKKIPLSLGENEILIEAVSRWGKKRTKKITVSFFRQ